MRLFFIHLVWALLYSRMYFLYIFYTFGVPATSRMYFLYIWCACYYIVGCIFYTFDVPATIHSTVFFVHFLYIWCACYYTVGCIFCTFFYTFGVPPATIQYDVFFIHLMCLLLYSRMYILYIWCACYYYIVGSIFGAFCSFVHLMCIAYLSILVQFLLGTVATDL
jgi:hypothetical protein